MAVGAWKTQRVYSAPLPPSPGAVESSLAQLHREEKPTGVELILAYTEETPLQGKGQSVALKAERKAWHPLNHYATVSLWCSPRFFHHEHILIISGM